MYAGILRRSFRNHSPAAIPEAPLKRRLALSAATLATLLVLPTLAWAAEPAALDLTRSTAGYIALILFAGAYLLVMAEEFTDLRKSKPVILTAGIIWAMIAYVYHQHGSSALVEDALRHNLLEFSELFLFLLAAMTYVNAMGERLVFETLRSKLVRMGFGYRPLFWLTGALAFFLSPFLDNLTTALVLAAVVLAVGKDSPRFVSLGCVNIVVAANAGGAFSPFGDITTLMVWQKGFVQFWTFFSLFVPALVNYVVPAALMHFAVPKGMPDASGKPVAPVTLDMEDHTTTDSTLRILRELRGDAFVSLDRLPGAPEGYAVTRTGGLRYVDVDAASGCHGVGVRWTAASSGTSRRATSAGPPAACSSRRSGRRPTPTRAAGGPRSRRPGNSPSRIISTSWVEQASTRRSSTASS